MSAFSPVTIEHRAPAGAHGLFPSPRALSGRQKAAIIVRLLVAHGVDMPLQALPESMQADLTAEIAQMRTIDRDTLQSVVEEFAGLLDRVGLSFPGGIEGALDLLGGRISAPAAGRARRRAGGTDEADPWERIVALDPAKLLAVLSEESTEVAAVILSKLPVPKAADLLGRLPGDRARRIALAIAHTGAMAPDTVARIGRALAAQFAAQPLRAFAGDPAGRVGAILNVSPALTREEVLKGLEADDGALAEEVRKTIFTFAHIPARVAARDVPKVLRGLDQETLVKALGGAKGEGEAAAEFILSNMSQRMAAALREEIAGAGRIRERDAEAAQTAVVIAVRELEAAGEIVLVAPEPEEEGE